MDIPELNIDVTMASINGQLFEVIDYDEYLKNKKAYEERTDLAISVNHTKEWFYIYTWCL